MSELPEPTYWWRPSEHEPLVPMYSVTQVEVMLAQAVRESELDVERLARAIDNFIRKQDGFDVDDAHAIAAEYAALRSDEAVKR